MVRLRSSKERGAGAGAGVAGEEEPGAASQRRYVVMDQLQCLLETEGSLLSALMEARLSVPGTSAARHSHHHVSSPHTMLPSLSNSTLFLVFISFINKYIKMYSYQGVTVVVVLMGISLHETSSSGSQ